MSCSQLPLLSDPKKSKGDLALLKLKAISKTQGLKLVIMVLAALLPLTTTYAHGPKTRWQILVNASGEVRHKKVVIVAIVTKEGMAKTL